MPGSTAGTDARRYFGSRVQTTKAGWVRTENWGIAKAANLAAMISQAGIGWDRFCSEMEARLIFISERNFAVVEFGEDDFDPSDELDAA